MNMIEVKALAKQRGVKPGKMKKQELIRSLQLAEGNQQCFNTGISTQCGQEDCLWCHDCN